MTVSENASGSRSSEPGGSGDEHPDIDSTTGSDAEREEHVGRVAGDDVGYAGETGAERRAEG